MKTHARAIAVAAISALALAACTGEDGPTTQGPSGAPQSSGGSPKSSSDDFAPRSAKSALDADATGPAPEVPGAKKGGTLAVSTSEAAPENLDPSTQYTPLANALLNLSVRRLTTYRMDGKRAILVPDMATDLGRPSADGMTWKFTLKKGLKYDDGSPIKASDVEYSVLRSFATAEMPNGPTFHKELFKGGESFEGPWKQPDDDFEGIDSDDETGTLTFHLTKRMRTFPYFATFSMFGAIPRDKDTDDPTEPAPAFATGPYRQVSSDEQGLRLTRNPHWDADSDPARHQYVDGYDVTFDADEDGTASKIMSDSGDGQHTVSLDGVPDSVEKQANGARRAQVATGASSCVSWNGATMDVQEIPLQVRKAVVAAWPTTAIRKAGGGTRFDSAPGGTIASPLLPGFTKYDLPASQNGQGPGSPTKARTMLNKAGHEGFTLRYNYIDNGKGRKVNRVKEKALTAAGFRVDATPLPKSEYIAAVKDPDDPANMGQGVATGWCPDWPAGDSVYSPLLSSTLDKNTGVGNVDDRELDSEMRRIEGLPLDQQGAAWSKFDRKVMTEIVPVVPMSYGRSSAIFGTKVHGVSINPNSGMPALSDISVK